MSPDLVVVGTELSQLSKLSTSHLGIVYSTVERLPLSHCVGYIQTHTVVYTSSIHNSRLQTKTVHKKYVYHSL